jgi:prophage DNA circulation protein
MMDGKLGALAKEIAEETAANLDMDFENATSVNDVFAKLMKDPKKIMGMVKDVGSKLDEKIKSGDIKESELLEEASELMKKMKEMPGMENIQSMLSKMGLGGKKLNTSAMQAHMERTMRLAQQKERLRARAGQKPVDQAPKYTPEELAEMEAKAEQARQELLAEWGDEPSQSVFRSGPRAERSSAKPTKGKKKGKKKK